MGSSINVTSKDTPFYARKTLMVNIGHRCV